MRGGALALALTLLSAGCVSPGGEDQAGPLDAVEGRPLVWPWEPLACDANSGKGLSSGADLGGPFGRSLEGMGSAIEGMLGLDAFIAKEPSPTQSAEWSFYDEGRGSASLRLQGSIPDLYVGWSKAWPAENETVAKAGLADALRRFDDTLEWAVEGGWTYHSPGAGWIALHGVGTSADGSRSAEATHRIERGVSSLYIRPALQPPAGVEGHPRHREAAEAYVACLEAAGTLDNRAVDASGLGPAPAHGAWTIPFGVRPVSGGSSPGGHCSYAPMTVYVDVSTLAIALDDRGVCL